MASTAGLRPESPLRIMGRINSERPKVRKCLFGKPDPKDTWLQDTLKEIYEKDSKKLDENYVPLGKMAPSEDVPEFYTRSVHKKPTKKCVSRIGHEIMSLSDMRSSVHDRLSPAPHDMDTSNSENVQHVSNTQSRSSPVMFTTPRQNSSFRQSHMNDFLPTRKRRGSNIENQRPRKALRD